MRFHSSPQRSCAENANERCPHSTCVRIAAITGSAIKYEPFRWTDERNVTRKDLEYPVTDVRITAVDGRSYLGSFIPVR
jgi:hypothetical protein